MLNIFNNLHLFFEDNYREINVREYARLMKISAPTASKHLFMFEKEGVLISRKDKNYILFRANRTNPSFIDLEKAYFRIVLEQLSSYLHEKINYNAVILFGSLIKGEVTISSDVDIYLDSKQKDMQVLDFEKKLNRKIQLHFKNSLENESLRNNISKGLLLKGQMI